MTLTRHVMMPIGGSEHAFCGLAFDAFSSGDHETDDEFVDAAPGVVVTCPDCVHAIVALRDAMKGLRLRAGPPSRSIRRTRRIAERRQ